MDAQKASELFPIWAEAEWKEIMEDKEPVRIWEPRKKEKPPKATPKKPERKEQENVLVMLIKDRRALAQALAVLTLCNVLTWCTTMHAVKKQTTEEVTARVTSELRAGFNKYLEDMEYERSASQFLTGDESLQTAMDAEADSLAQLLYGYRNNSLRDRKTLIWCVLARVDSAAYPGSVADVVGQKQQWMFYSSGNPIRQDDKDLALEQLKLWHEGKYPAGFSDDYVYAEWSSSDIALRNTWEKDRSTSWWRFPE